jgi:hypothetical protein
VTTRTHTSRTDRGPTRPDRVETPARRAVVVTLVVVAVVAVVAAVFGLRAVLDDEPVASDSISVPHGTLVVNSVTPEVMKHPKGMPASMMPDPIPDGFQRFSIDVTVFAEEDESARYDSGDLRVSARDVEPTAPLRGTLGSGTIPAGGQVTGTALFQVPDDVRVVDLGVTGEDQVVRVRIPRNVGHHSG